MASGHRSQYLVIRRWNWVRVTLLLVGAFGLFVVSTVPDHFLGEHLWRHVADIPWSERVFHPTLEWVRAHLPLKVRRSS